jgi:hypothetical protein
VRDRAHRRRGLGARLELGLESALEDGAHAPVGGGATGEGTTTRRRQPLGTMALTQTDDPQARAEALLRMDVLGQDGFDHGGDGRPALLCPAPSPSHSETNRALATTIVASGWGEEIHSTQS